MKTLLSALAALSVQAAAHAMPPQEQEAWREDLSVYAETLEAGHIDLFHTLSREDFQAALEALERDLPQIARDEAVARLMRIQHAIGDGHTAIPLWGFGYHLYPVTFRMYEGQVFITGIGEAHADLLGAVVEGVNGHAIADVTAALGEVVPFVENDGSLAVRIPRYMTVAELMRALGFIEADGLMALTLSDGRSVTLASANSADARAAQTHRIDYRATLEADEIRASAQGLSFTTEADTSLGYIRFDSYPPADEMDRFAAEVVEIMEAEGLQNLAIDLRGNFGGDFYTGLRLSHQLNLMDQIDWMNGVYVLTGQITFSAAMSNSAQFSDLINARRVGERTGATPCGYQDMGQFTLPNSGLLITYSKRLFCFADPVEEALQPDVHIPVTIQHWRDGHDAALAWIRADIGSR